VASSGLALEPWLRTWRWSRGIGAGNRGIGAGAEAVASDLALDP